MCLLITGKASEVRATLLKTKDMLDDIFASNSDGVGAMYVTAKGVLRTPKVLPKDVEQARAFIAQLPNDDRSIAIHWRMKTHGAIDLLNCHPYDVIPGQVALMHNGVLSQGNKADVTKSDTWHYIKDVVRPMLELAPGLMTNAAWLNLVEDDITGNNRFAIMNAAGELVVLNKHTGIEHDGIWFSNTYAWDPSVLIPNYRKVSKYAGRGSFLFDDVDDVWDNYYQRQGYGPKSNVVDLTKSKTPLVAIDDDDLFNSEDVWRAVDKKDCSGLEDILWSDAALVFETLFKDCRFVTDLSGDEPNKSETEIIEMLEAGDADAAAKIVNGRSGIFGTMVSQAIVWYGDWYPKADTDPDALTPADQEALKSLTGLSEEEYNVALAEYAAKIASKVPDPVPDEVAALTAGAACVSEYAG